MERCGTCRWWLQYMKTEGHNCVSSERAERLSFDSCPPADFGCPFHEPRPASLTCGGCEEFGGNHNEGYVLWSGDHLYRCLYDQKTAVLEDRPACEHYKAQAEEAPESLCESCGYWLFKPFRCQAQGRMAYRNDDGAVLECTSYWGHE